MHVAHSHELSFTRVRNFIPAPHDGASYRVAVYLSGRFIMQPLVHRKEGPLLMIQIMRTNIDFTPTFPRMKLN